LTIAVTLISVMLFWRHRSNIRGLLAGSEGKFGSG
jgi:glycerol-3-phosphate acyltransferase PlsY